MVNESDRGTVLQVTHANNGNLAAVMFLSTLGQDLSGYEAGSLQFDVKVVSGDPEFTVKVDCFYPCTSGDKPLGALGEQDWETVTVPVSELTASGLNLADVNTGLVIFATKFEDTVFLLDHVQWVVSSDGSADTDGDGITDSEDAFLMIPQPPWTLTVMVILTSGTLQLRKRK